MGQIHVEKNVGGIEETVGRLRDFVEQEKPKRGRTALPVIVAGDFNSDPWRKESEGEQIFDMLEQAGFTNVLKFMPEKRRWTHPNRRYGNSALDHILVRGFKIDGIPLTQYPDELSDHFALFVRVK